MRHIKRLIGVLVPIVLVGLSAAGCVDSESSLKIRGVAAPSGSAESQDIDCPPNSDDSVATPKITHTCSEVSPGSVSQFYSRLSLDVSAFRQNGQLGPTRGDVSNKTFCGYDSPTSEFTQRFSYYGSFAITFDVLNNLEDSREVGAKGQGGGQGGFDGIKQDKNDIETESLKVRFPQVDASELERDVKFTMIVDSAGGAIAPSMALFNQNDISALRDLHKKLAVRRTESNSYDENAKSTAVTVTAEMWITGETFGGQKVESNRLTFPIKLCGSGCGVTPRCVFSSGD